MLKGEPVCWLWVPGGRAQAALAECDPTALPADTLEKLVQVCTLHLKADTIAPFVESLLLNERHSFICPGCAGVAWALAF